VTAGPYEFAGLPVEPIAPGTSLLVAGPSHAGSRELALRLLSGPDGEGAIVVTTNRRAGHIARECRAVGMRIGVDRTGILDCVGGGDGGGGEDGSEIPARVLTVTGPGDLTGIGMRYSKLSREFADGGITRIRTGLRSVSTLLSFSDLRTVSRFVHTLVGRIDRDDGLGTLHVDPTIHDERTVSTLAQFCDGRVDVREGEDGPELRVRGAGSRSRDWRPFDPYAAVDGDPNAAADAD